MTETLFALVSDWGVPALALATFLSCLALPVPVSLMMLAAGAFIATGDLSAPALVGATLFGALLGDQAGYQIGRLGGSVLRASLGRRPAHARLIAGAEARITQSGWVAVFLSRWLFSPLGPYVNLLAGGACMKWLQFTLPAAFGEFVWVTSTWVLDTVLPVRYRHWAICWATSSGWLHHWSWRRYLAAPCYATRARDVTLNECPRRAVGGGTAASEAHYNCVVGNDIASHSVRCGGCHTGVRTKSWTILEIVHV